MLRSYQITEKSYLTYSISGENFQEKELELSHKFVQKHHIRDGMNMECPICKNSNSSYFFTKWDVDYLRCNECDSIFAVCDRNVVEDYKLDKELSEFRVSTEYQEMLSMSRADIWEELIDWLYVRCYRFLKRNRGLKIVDYGMRMEGFISLMESNELAGAYDVRESIFDYRSNTHVADGEADVVLYNDRIKTEIDPINKLLELKRCLKDDGILILGARAGSGFDVITLKGYNKNIYPYEHILLPSVKGIRRLLEITGFELLEITSPGVMDVRYVMDSLDKLDDREGFVRYMLSESDPIIIQEFQRFLQKSCLSSFIRVIARKKPFGEGI